MSGLELPRKTTLYQAHGMGYIALMPVLSTSSITYINYLDGFTQGGFFQST